MTAAALFVQNSAGGSFIDGTTSGANSQLQVYTTVAGQITGKYQTPATKGTGTAVIQVVTVDEAGDLKYLINTANLGLQ
ncbi:hypothetical protein [Geotalea daltonii]|uniref:hypothetical protein n=1 Tax=Geotalea daltonii TaxID=1203471 RepID=UPI0012B63B10|nr:hypothetical protein [Geotalea daltonii]